ncbi:MAG: RNA polymerase sigma factor [Proteobacteria bacterium]|nr:MAG: RNA polymerase sigma factor [Pseudomonadota bacterium]
MKEAPLSSSGPVSKIDSKREQVIADAFTHHGRKLLSLIRGRIRDQVEAEDIAQEVFTDFVEAYDLEVAIESLGAWLYSAARNKIVDRFRRSKNATEYRVREMDQAQGESTSDSRPDEEWDTSLLREQIGEAMNTLPPEQLDVFVKHELEGKSYEEISRETGVGVNTLLSRKRYGVLTLRKQLKEVFDDYES